MSDLVVNKSGLPFVLGGASALNVRLGALDPTQALPDAVNAVFDVSATGGAGGPLNIGGAGSATVSLKAGASASLKVIRPASQLARDYGLTPFFQQRPDYLALLLDVGANADGSFNGTIGYAGLTAGATMEAGAQARFGYVHAYPKTTAVMALIPDFFGQVRVPALVGDTPGPGEVSRLEFGGYLKLGLQMGAGFSVKGTPSLELGALQLSERYELSVIGSIGFNAQVAGMFSVEVRGATDAGGKPADNWARVIVTRSRSDQFSIAGDVKVNATSDLEGLPESPDEFLSALLGVGVKNWLHVLERVTTLSDPAQLETELDALSTRFLTEWTGEAVDALDKAGLGRVLARVKQVVDQYNGLENTVITAFDRYFNELTAPLTSPALGGEIAQAIETVANLPSWGSLNGQIDPAVWRIVTELTDGDPLSWLLTKQVSALQARARQLLNLGADTAHKDLREVIALVKGQFGLTPLFAELDKLDTIPKLKAQANTRIGAFVKRLTGTAVDGLADSDAGRLLARVHLVLTNAQTFERTAYAKFTAALAQTASFNLHAAYSRAGNDDAFVDIAVNVGTAEGRELLQECALGDFSRALGGNRQDLVRINEGRLVHKVVTERSVAVTVVGWQKAFSYSSIDQLIVEADQRLVTEANGGVTAYTTLSLEKVRDQKRNGERTLTNLMLRFVGESSGVLTTSQENQQFLIDAITGMSARYQLTYEDAKTTAGELASYVSFAKSIGLDQPALEPAGLAVLLPSVGPDNFGATSVQYDVRYTEDGLKALFTAPFQEPSTRETMRRVVLASYLQQGGELADVGWAYWTAGIYKLWKAGQAGFVKQSTQEYSGIQASPFSDRAAPPKVQIGPERQRLLSTLYYIEDQFVAGFRALHDLVSNGRRISPSDFERALGNFGKALDAIDRFAASENGAFAVFDDLQRRAAPAASRTSSLTLTSRIAAAPVSKVFLSPA